MLAQLPSLVLWATATSVPAGVALLCTLLWTHSVQWAWTLLGAFLLDAFCFTLKGLLKHPRPRSNSVLVLPSEGPFGMPSEHAAFAWFLVAHLGLRLLRHRGFYPELKLLGVSILALWAVGVAGVRHATGAHSVEQLLAGAALGAPVG